MLDELSESRPLAKLQREMEEAASAEDGSLPVSQEQGATIAAGGDGDATEQATAEVSDAQAQAGAPGKTTTPPGSPALPRKPLLNPFDSELVRVSNVSLFRHLFGWAHGRYCRGYTGVSTPLMRRERTSHLLLLYLSIATSW
jgi:hypothetical protein